MKTAMKYLSLLLCFELIVAPVTGSVMLSTKALAQDESCPSGQVFNTSLNRCVTKPTVASAKENTESCRKIENEEKRKECYKNNAENITAQGRDEEIARCNALKDDKDKKKCLKNYEERSTAFLDKDGNATAANIATSAAAVALPLLFMIKALADKKSFSKCKPASLLLMYGGGGALLVGEVVSFIQHANNLKKMEEARESFNVKENANNSDDNKVIASEAQSQAFELLAQNEDSIAAVAKTKKITYGVATGLFAAGAIMATIEQIQYAQAQVILKTPPVTAADAQRIMMAKQRIMKLTCQDDVQKGKENVAAADDILKEDQLKKQELANAGGNGTTGTGGTNNTSGGKNGISINSIISVVTMGAPLVMSFIKKTPSDSPAPSPTYNPNNTNENTPQDCGPGQQWSAKKKQCIQVSSVDINEILNLKYKKKAAQNIRHAKSYTEMIQLLAETESMDYESYSRPGYYDEDLLNESLKEVPFYVQAAGYVADLIFPSAHAQDGTVNEGGTGGSNQNPTPAPGAPDKVKQVEAAKSKVGKIMDKAVYTPAGRLVTNGLLGTWMGIMTAHMVKQQRLSEERAKLLRKMKSEFENQGGIAACTSADRTDPGVPSCFCFTSDNKPNPSTMNSKVCAMTLAGLNPSQNNQNNVKVCVTQNMTADPGCGCRKTNSCMTVPTSFKMSGINPGTFKMLSSATGAGNDLMTGNMGAGNMDAGAIGTNAARLKEVADKMASKDPKLKKQSEDLSKALLSSTAGIPAMGPGYSSGASSLPSSPAAAAAALDKEIKKANGETEVTTAGNQGSNGAIADFPAEPEFGMDENMLAAQESEIAEVMAQDLDMGNNDINSGSSTNIFDVLSNRYQRSGMRRLFDDQNKVKADAAAKTDISE